MEPREFELTSRAGAYICEFGVGREVVLEDDLDVGEILLVDAIPEDLLGFLLIKQSTLIWGVSLILFNDI